MNNNIIISFKSVCVVGLIIAMLLVSTFFLGIHIGSNNISALPNGVETAALPINKGGTGALTASDARDSLGITSELAKKAVDVGNITNYTFSNIKALVPGVGQSAVGFNNRLVQDSVTGGPMDYAQVLIVNQTGNSHIWIKAWGLDGAMKCANYTTGTPAWTACGLQIGTTATTAMAGNKSVASGSIQATMTSNVGSTYASHAYYNTNTHTLAVTFGAQVAAGKSLAAGGILATLPKEACGDIVKSSVIVTGEGGFGFTLPNTPAIDNVPEANMVYVNNQEDASVCNIRAKRAVPTGYYIEFSAVWAI
ncbi:MAG: hypothetical protein LBN03_00920 [Bifidobacteriaceae bacterium]|nr:hypothetical protein [Bifidobacteriaceae bacterium]